MMEAVTPDGEVVTIAEAAKHIPQPRYWRRTEGIIEGEPGLEYETAFFKAQMEIEPVIKAESESPFGTKDVGGKKMARKYASLSELLGKVRPIIGRHELTIKQGAGRIISHGGVDGGPRKQLILPVWTELRHYPTGQWERVYIEIPLVKIDAQAMGSALTYGRRYLIQSLFSIGATDDDGVLASYRAGLSSNPLGEAADGMVEQINACKTIEELKSWYAKNDEGFQLLSEDRLDVLREAYKGRLEALKNAAPEPEKPKKNGKPANGEAAHA